MYTKPLDGTVVKFSSFGVFSELPLQTKSIIQGNVPSLCN